MDTYIREIQDVLGALAQYFDTMKGYIISNHPNRGTRLEKLLYDNSQLLEKFTGIVKRKSTDLQDTFHTVHLLQLVTKNLARMYDLLQFPLEVSEELSSTRLETATDMFNDITRIYRLFIKDVRDRFDTLVHGLYDSIEHKDDFAAASAAFQKYPASIQLYILYQSAIMDRAYREKNRALQNDLSAIIEKDKSYVLDEKEWQNAYLSFNMTPHGPTCKDVKTLIGYIRSTSINVQGETLDALRTGLEALKMGLVVITRMQAENGILHQPAPLDIKTGISEERARAKVLEFFQSKSANWTVEVNSYNWDNYLVVENLGTLFRMLVPRVRDSLVVHRSFLQNMMGVRNDRPQRYNNLITSHIMKHWNRHVYEFMKSDIPPHEVVVRIEHLQKTIIKVYRDDTSKHAWHKRVISQAVQDTFKDTLGEILGTQLHDMRFYIVNDMNDQFVAACSTLLGEGDEPDSREKDLLQVEGIYHEALTRLVRNNRTVFGILGQNEYILKAISDIILKVEDLRPRRDPDKSSADI